MSLRIGIMGMAGRMGRLLAEEDVGGEVRYRGVDLLSLDEKVRRHVRANRIAMIFQDALSALNPVFTVGFQIAEQFRIRRGMSRKDAKQRAIEMLDQVKIPNARGRINDFPHQFSGSGFSSSYRRTRPVRRVDARDRRARRGRLSRAGLTRLP